MKKVTIKPYTDAVRRCADGVHTGMAFKKPNTRWAKACSLFHTIFTPGETMELGEFKKRYTGLLMAVGFNPKYAKDMSQDCHITNGPAHCRWIDIV